MNNEIVYKYNTVCNIVRFHLFPVARIKIEPKSHIDTHTQEFHCYFIVVATAAAGIFNRCAPKTKPKHCKINVCMIFKNETSRIFITYIRCQTSNIQNTHRQYSK